LTVIFEIFGFLLCAYIFWKRLKEDFPAEEIFSLAWPILILGVVLGRLVYILSNFNQFRFNYSSWVFWSELPGLSLPGIFLAGVLALTFFSKRKKWDVWLVADSFLPPFLIAVLIINLPILAREPSSLVVARALLAFLVFLVGKGVEKNYRSFSWYKSGRVGFLASFLTIAFFGPLLVLDIFLKKALYLEEYLNGLVVVFAGVLLYYRSGRQIKEDIEKLFSFLVKPKNDRQN